MGHCLFCGRFFRPDPHAGGRQKSCPAPDCRKRRKQESQWRWVKANPDYFRGRSDNTRTWRKAYPGYQKAWRAKGREIQDESLPPEAVKSIRLWYRPGFRVRYKTRSGWKASIDAAPG